MLYMISETGTKLLILESANLDAIREGRPAVSPDKSVMIAFTPDPVWLADKLMDCDGDCDKIAALIEEGMKRPQKEPNRPKHGTHIHKFIKEIIDGH